MLNCYGGALSRLCKASDVTLAEDGKGLGGSSCGALVISLWHRQRLAHSLADHRLLPNVLLPPFIVSHLSASATPGRHVTLANVHEGATGPTSEPTRMLLYNRVRFSCFKIQVILRRMCVTTLSSCVCANSASCLRRRLSAAECLAKVYTG
jgi:hypothetical protein